MPDFLEIPHEDAIKERVGDKEPERSKARRFLIELYPLQLKTLIITLN